MISDAALATLCMALYDYPWRDDALTHWDFLEQPHDDHGVSWALKTVDGYDVVTFRGSTTLHDWFFNFVAVAVPIEQGALGPIHPGFRHGLQAAWGTLKPLIRNPLVLTGHSLGGAHASILSGMALLDGVKVARKVTFGEPKPGFAKLAAITHQVPGVTYLNGWDLIPSLPVRLPPLENYKHDRPLTRVDVVPYGPALTMGPFGWHHMLLYEDACKAIGEKDALAGQTK